jgi:succinoglycan biosynthesis transport protein ExoP
MDNSFLPTRHQELEGPRAGYPSALIAPARSGAFQDGDLLAYWGLLRSRKGTLILSAFFGFLIGVLFTLSQTPVYQARTSLEIQDLNQDFMNMRQTSPVTDSSAINALSDMQTQIKILQSETLAERTLAKLKIAMLGDFKADQARFAAWRQVLNLPQRAALQAREELLEAAAKSMKVRAAGQTRIIEILVYSTDPKVASGFANTMTSEFITQNMEARWTMIQRTSEWLGLQLDEMRVKLEHSEDALQAYARQNGLIYTSEKQNVSEDKLHQLQAELSKAEADRVGRQSRYEIARTTTTDTLPDVLNDSNLRVLQMNLTDLRRQEAELSATFKPDYSKAKKVRAQIASLESAMERERRVIVDRIGNDFHESQRREELLASAYQTQVRLVTKDSESSIQYNILKREVDTNRQIYEAMLQRVKESGIAAAMKASNIRIIDPARFPKRPSGPSLPINGSIGLLLGLMFGVAFVVMRERGDRTLMRPGDAAFFLGVSELGAIPSSSIDTRLGIYGRGKKFLAPGGRSLSRPRVELVTWQKPSSLLTESFRSVLTSIMFAGENGSRPRVLVVSSANPLEGKSTAASNLAIALAKINQKVLLIDCDLRKPSIHTIFHLPNDNGLIDLLLRRSLDQVAADACICATPIPNLWVLTAGASIGIQADLLFSNSMLSLIAHYKEQFDMVIIDTPPMLQVPDARLLGRISDAVVLIVRAGLTTRDAAVAARNRFAEDGTRILGVVLNDWNPKSSPEGSYGYYKASHDKNSCPGESNNRSNHIEKHS